VSKVTLDVNLGPHGKVVLTEGHKPVTLVEIRKDRDMLIEIGTGFGTGANVSAFGLFHTKEGRKGSSIGTWRRTEPGTQPSSILSVSSSGPAAIVVKDTDTTNEDGLFFFSVHVTDGSQVFDTDPELKVKKIGGDAQHHESVG